MASTGTTRFHVRMALACGLVLGLLGLVDGLGKASSDDCPTMMWDNKTRGIYDMTGRTLEEGCAKVGCGYYSNMTEDEAYCIQMVMGRWQYTLATWNSTACEQLVGYGYNELLVPVSCKSGFATWACNCNVGPSIGFRCIDNTCQPSSNGLSYGDCLNLCTPQQGYICRDNVCVLSSDTNATKSQYDVPLHRFTLVPFSREERIAVCHARPCERCWRQIAIMSYVKRKVKALLPDSLLFNRLVNFERRLDAAITRKRLEIQDALRRPPRTNAYARTHPAPILAPRHFKQIALSTTFFFFFFALVLSVGPFSTLRVTVTRLWEPHMPPVLDDPERLSELAFSDLLRTMVVDIEFEDGAPRQTTQWSRAPSSVAANGFEIRRTARLPKLATLLLVQNDLPPRFKLPPMLANILGLYADTKGTITHTLWAYIMQNKLIDPKKDELITCDKYLKHIFSKEKLAVEELSIELDRVLLPVDPIRIPVTFARDKHTEVQIFDVIIPLSLEAMDTTFLLAPSTQKRITELNMTVEEHLAALDECRKKRDTLLALHEDPQTYILSWVASQREDEKLLEGGPGLVARLSRTERFQEPWVDEAIASYFTEQANEKRHNLDDRYRALLAAHDQSASS
ncbi:uncharacterized protein MONBRDRAFT_38471 [Monosiga brevicollis MX1]|uniref:DM2 domain-containing protein n=1 Tax=Monosiga brevicollis TaxID=81824 RepID=A9V808_MONBE|nr:uncharacterized protein MONBRDRAFT_38471 [Monosiga brevicollis MX1]EDQ86397.1 predicted protein [Monosiga brevicollis MX1]|eukprot:XP_001748787.1 hypothetical protein [Monosiga brevicollis MX1]